MATLTSHFSKYFHFGKLETGILCFSNPNKSRDEDGVLVKRGKEQLNM